MSSVCGDTRRSSAIAGSSTPTTPAVAERSASRSRSASRIDLRRATLIAGTWRYGSISPTPSSPRARPAATEARSMPTTTAVLTRVWARSVRRWSSDGTSDTGDRSTSWTRPSTRSNVSGVSAPCAIPAPCRRPTVAQTWARTPSSSSARSASASERPPPRQHDQRVLGLGRTGDHHARHGHAPGGGEQGDEALVLDLLLPGQRHGRRTPVPDRPPHPRQELCVAGVAPVDLDHDGIAGRIGALDDEDAAGLAGRLVQVGRVEVDLTESRCDLAQGGAAHPRAEHQVHRRRGGDGREQREQRAGRRRRAEHHHRRRQRPRRTSGRTAGTAATGAAQRRTTHRRRARAPPAAPSRSTRR